MLKEKREQPKANQKMVGLDSQLMAEIVLFPIDYGGKNNLKILKSLL